MTWRVALTGFGTFLIFCTSCNSPATPTATKAALSQSQTAGSPASGHEDTRAAVVAAAISAERPQAPANLGAAVRAPRATALKLRRFVVTSGVRDREPMPSEAALVADGQAIFAFAELANEQGVSQDVRITFERRGGVERVGNVTLPVPGQVSRHRTWAMTRFIRSPGVWDAVLWSESGQELARTSFEVEAS